MRKPCPYCGEEIAATAKKCRFCGEWLAESAPQYANEEAYEEVGYVEEETLNIPVDGENSAPLARRPRGNVKRMPNQSAPMMNNQHPNQGLQQNIVVQPQIVVENKQEVYQEQNVIIESVPSGSESNSESSSGCLFTQISILAVGVGIASKSFWYGVAAFIILAILIFIPFLGSALCVILGLAFGAIGGVTCHTLGAPTWVAWLVGILATVGLIYGNLEQRKKERED